MPKKEVNIKSFHIIGIPVRTTNKNNQAMKDIGEVWERFYTDGILAKTPSKVDETIYALYTDYETDFQGEYTFILGCKVNSLDNIPEDLKGHTVTGGHFLKFSTKGKIPDAVGQQWQDIWVNDDSLNRAYTTDFEVYSKKTKDFENAEVDIFLAQK